MIIEFRKLQEWLQNMAMAMFRKYSIPKWLVFLHDNFAVFLTFLLAFVLRFNFVTHDFKLDLATQQAIAAVSIYIIFSLIFRSYSGMIRHTTIIDIFYVFLTTTVSFLTLILIAFAARLIALPGFMSISISILTIHYVLITVYLFGVRITIKTFYHLITSTHSKKKKVIIFGAGAMGVIVKRVLLSDIKGAYNVAGFLDNNKNLQGKKLNGIPVYSPNSITRDFLRKHNIETMVFAIRDISPSEKSEIIRNAIDLGLEVLNTPAVETWLNGELQMRQIEKVKLEDLLGRDPIELNLKKIGSGLQEKTILVTGAAGSIGSEIVRQLTRFPIKKLILLDQAETPMFHLENELRSMNNCFAVKLILADITNSEKLDHIFKAFQPEIVFHAAAYKHVPLMEDNPHEGVRVNVGGTKNIMQFSVKYGIKKFVMISTDKAVNPTNVMGATKRLCEMIVQAKAHQADNKTQFVITRFGNVLGSNGSVIPLFTKQIEEGGPVTVTDPGVTRYFMTIPEACQLVLEAGFMGKGGEIFVFDMGKPVKIIDLAHQMIRLSGLVPEKDIKIVYSGLRPGEKLYEELLTDKEHTLPTHHSKIKIAQVESANDKIVLTKVNTLLSKLYNLKKSEVVESLRELVPEYHSNNVTYNRKEDKEQSYKVENGMEKNVILNSFDTLKQLINPTDIK